MIRKYHNHIHITMRKRHIVQTERQFKRRTSSLFLVNMIAKIVSEYDQDIPQD